MTVPSVEKLAIIGSGPAGYTAAIYAARANLSPLLISGTNPGGQLMITTEVENFPGFSTILGPELMEAMEKQVRSLGVRILEADVTAVDFANAPYALTVDTGAVISATSVIIATGAKARWLGLTNETYYRGYGVSACATCDAPFFKGQTVAVVGGGNAAVEEAIYLTHHAAKVYLIHRRDQLRAEKIAQDRLFVNPKITCIWNTQVEDIMGCEAPRRVTHIRLRDQQGVASELAVDGLFVAIGHDPATHLFRDWLAMDAEGYLTVAPATTQTSRLGIFAAGDVQDKIFRQAITAAGQGCMAALEAERYLSNISG